MKVITGVEDFSPKAGFVGVALGNFDGVHLGHQFLIRQLVEKTKTYKGTSVVFSFQPHPLKVLHQQKPLLLLTGLADKERIIRKLAVDYFLQFPFNQAVAKMPPRYFVEEILIKGLGADHLFVGFNYTFGRKAEGTADLLRRICAEYGCAVTVIPPVTKNGICVSSTLIRESLIKGDVGTGRSLLGHPYCISGTVVHGEAIGRSLGYPTANLLPETDLVIPADGVYAVKVETGDEQFDGVANIGRRPTIGQDLPRTIEIHLLGQKVDLYDQWIRVFFIERLRDEIRFSGPEELASQIKRDAEQAGIILREAGVSDL